MDVHVPFGVTEALRRRGVDVLRAQEDGAEKLRDPELLDRALQSERIVFTQDEDFLVEGTRRQRNKEPFAGIIFGHQIRVTIGQCVHDLELMAKVYDLKDMANRIEYLPLK